ADVEGLLFEDILHLLPEFGGKVPPDFLAADIGVARDRLCGVRGRGTAGQGSGGLAGLLTRGVAGPPGAPDHHPHRGSGAVHLLDQGLDPLDDLLLLTPSSLAGVGLAQLLLDLPHLLDDLAHRTAPLLIVGLAFLPAAGQLLQALVDLLVLDTDLGAVGSLAAGRWTLARLLFGRGAAARAVVGRGCFLGLAEFLEEVIDLLILGGDGRGAVPLGSAGRTGLLAGRGGTRLGPVLRPTLGLLRLALGLRWLRGAIR